MAVTDDALEDRKNESVTVQTLKTAKTKRKNSAQSPSAPKTKKLKVETDKASNIKSESHSTEAPSTSMPWAGACKKEEDEDDCAFGQPPLKTMKTETSQGQPDRVLANAGDTTEEMEMSWDIVQVRAAFVCTLRCPEERECP